MDMYSVVKENPILAILRNIPLEYTVDYAQAIVDGGISFFEVALNSRAWFKTDCNTTRSLWGKMYDRSRYSNKCGSCKSGNRSRSSILAYARYTD